MQALLSRGAQVSSESLDVMLKNAAEGDNAAEALPMLIALNDPSAEIRSQRAITAIVALISSPMYNFQIFEKMLKMVLDVNQFGSDGVTMLVAAVCRGRLGVVMALLNHGADVNKKTSKGVLPLYAASKLDHSIITKLLISLGASIHGRNDNGKYPIHGACSSRTVENLHFLLSHGASLNVTDYNGTYPIHIARFNMYTEIIHFLLSLGTSINVIDGNGNTAFPLNHNWEDLHPTNVLFIKQFALLHVTTGAVSKKDWTVIQEDLKKLKFYETCYNQLHIMSETMIFENFNLLTLLASSTSKLSFYLRNSELSEAISNCLQQQCTRFPIYYKQLVMALQIAKKKRDIIQVMDTVLEQSFPVKIPYLAIKKITHYLLFEELTCLELNYYSSLYKRINAKGLDFISTVMS